MSDDITLSGPAKDFEAIKHIDKHGIEYWDARELMPLLGYIQWRAFEEVIAKAAKACINSGQSVDNHFARISKMVPIGSNAVREVTNYKVDRYACYLIAQNGDPSKSEIALAQTYFVLQTRRHELYEKSSEEEKRVFIRDEVRVHNKKLAGTARGAGVTKFGMFNDAGYRGLYGMPLSDVERRKGINKGELLDRSGATELAANLFRITQTEEKIRKDGVQGDQAASRTHFMVGGKVRQTIKDIGGALPEELPAARHIKEVRKDIKRLRGVTAKTLKAGVKKLKRAA